MNILSVHESRCDSYSTVPELGTTQFMVKDTENMIDLDEGIDILESEHGHEIAEYAKE